MTLREILEILYFLSGPTLVIVVVIGLRQLKISKDISRISAKRESYRLAAEQCGYYFTHTIPLQNELDKSIRDKKVTFFNESKVQINGGKIKIQYPKNTDLEQLINITPEILKVYNNMEAFSLFFISGVADDVIGFSSVGATFCYEVRKLLPDLMLSASKGEHFKNIMKLFLLWDARLQAEGIMRDKKALEAKLQAIDTKEIRPVGTED